MEESQQQKTKSIKDVYADKSLTPQERQSKIAQIMGYTTCSDDNEHETLRVESTQCTHYTRKCWVKCDKCDEFVECRLCHKELDRFKVKIVKCKECGCEQPCQQQCHECDTVFGDYYCDVCHLFDSNEQNPKFHCDDCGVCRIGQQEQSAHCSDCNNCWNLDTFDNHKCYESTSQECCICQENMDHVFNDPPEKQVLNMKCGHMFHSGCVDTYLKTDYRCPICRKSFVDLVAHTAYIDERLQALEEQANIDDIPEKLRTKEKDVLCNECEIQFTALFSPFQIYKCTECGCYNTQLIIG